MVVPHLRLRLQLLLFTASTWCRRLSPEQSQASAQALQSTAPDDDFVIAMIQHWWHPAASARDADQSTSTQGQSQAPLGAARAGQAQGQQPFAAHTVSNLQAAAVGHLTEQLLAEGAEGRDSQQGSRQHPESVTAHLHPNQAEGTSQRMPQGRTQEQSFGFDVQPQVKQGSSGHHRHSTAELDHPVQLTGAEAAPPQPRAESTVRTVNAGGSCNVDTNDFLFLCLFFSLRHSMLK